MKRITIKVYKSFFKKEDPIAIVTIVSGRKGFLRWLEHYNCHSFEIFDEDGNKLTPITVLKKGGEYDS